MNPEKNNLDLGIDVQKNPDTKYKEALIRCRQKGFFGMTAEDHRSIGSTPDPELSQNPGKCLADLWSIDKIRNFLNRRLSYLEEARCKYKNDPNSFFGRYHKQWIKLIEEDFREDFSYLESIDKLPKKFKNFEIKDSENDPKD